MLDYRDVNTTKIMSCSTFCYDEFKRFFGEKYTKFDIDTILHTSELDNRIKTSFNKNQ